MACRDATAPPQTAAAAAGGANDLALADPTLAARLDAIARQAS